jgi:DNA-binding NarL/FixJ family response regulator
VVRKGVKQILTETKDILSAGEASSGKAVMRALGEGSYDVLILDVAMPDGGGLEILSRVRALHPRLRVLVLSIYPEKQYALRALKGGAAGYLTKESAPDELVAAIRKVAAGGKYVSQALADVLADELMRGADRLPHERLSDREFQVLKMLAAGKTVTEIASEFSLSVKTVSTFRARILGKLGLKNTTEIVRFAIEHKLIS